MYFFDAILSAFGRLYYFIVFMIAMNTTNTMNTNVATTTNLAISLRHLELDKQEDVEYENKYLTEYQEMPPDAIFSNYSENQSVLDTECQRLLVKLKSKLELLRLFERQNMELIISNDTLCDYVLEHFTGSEYVVTKSVEEENYDSDKENDFVHLAELKEVEDSREQMICGVCYKLDALAIGIQTHMEHCLVEIENYPSLELMQEARELACKNTLDPRLIYSHIEETTPIGNVIMRYNFANSAFEYFSDRCIPRRYLETVGRKYVVDFHCPHIYIDTQHEIELAVKKNAENAKKQKVYETSEVYEKSKNIFAKFKSYNQSKQKTQTGGSKISYMQSHPTKNRSMSSVSPYQFKSPEDKEQNHVLTEHSNTYIQLGRLTEFPPLLKQNGDNNILETSKIVTYSEYKASLKKI